MSQIFSSGSSNNKQALNFNQHGCSSIEVLRFFFYVFSVYVFSVYIPYNDPCPDPRSNPRPALTCDPGPLQGANVAAEPFRELQRDYNVAGGVHLRNVYLPHARRSGQTKHRLVETALGVLERIRIAQLEYVIPAISVFGYLDCNVDDGTLPIDVRGVPDGGVFSVGIFVVSGTVKVVATHPTFSFQFSSSYLQILTEWRFYSLNKITQWCPISIYHII